MADRPAFVYFDLGNVLCFFDHATSARQMAEVAGSDSATLRRLVFESDLEHRYETGLITGEDFVAEIADKLECKLSTAEMLEAASAMFQPNLAILSVLESIRDLGIPMGLLSNTNKAHWEWISRQHYPVVDGWFDPIILSYEVKVMKPDRTIYELATARANVSAERIFFTDDRHDNCRGAKAANWQVFQFVDAASLLKVVQGWR
ncbi:MAG: HAD family phosphatase [Pirellulaceae bacterium]|nr:HAD family phosphatase [Pirellulaceae bacterium]